jgi:hypothetical protein
VYTGTVTDTSASIQRVCSALRQLQYTTTLLTERDHTVVCVGQMQTVFGLKFTSTTDKTIHEVLMTHAIAAEKLSPGGFDLCLEIVIEQFKGLSVGVQSLCGQDCVMGDRRVSSKPSNRTLLDNVVNIHATGATLTVRAALTAALNLAGFAGHILLEKTPSMIPSVELVRGYTFELQQLLSVDINFSSPRVFCIDGYVESVSEVHHLLEAASEAKEPCVLFVRGMSDDVKHTLRVNYDRGALKVIPVAVPFDLDSMNTLIDLSIVSGADLVSSLKGDLISAVKFGDAPRVDQLTVYKGRVVISHVATHQRVLSHVTELMARRLDEQLDDKRALLSKRIKSLSPNQVVVRLPDDRHFVTHTQIFDKVLRAVKSAIDYGVTDDGRLVATDLAARVHAARALETLWSLGGVVNPVS